MKIQDFVLVEIKVNTIDHAFLQKKIIEINQKALKYHSEVKISNKNTPKNENCCFRHFQVNHRYFYGKSIKSWHAISCLPNKEFPVLYTPNYE